MRRRDLLCKGDHLWSGIKKLGGKEGKWGRGTPVVSGGVKGQDALL